MRVKVPVDTLTKTVPDGKAKTPLDRLSDIKAMAPMIRLADTLAETEAVSLGDISKYVETDILLESLYYNLVDTEIKKLVGIVNDVKCEAISMLHSR